MSEKDIKLIRDNGFFTVESLIYTPSKDLEGMLHGLGPKKVDKIIVGPFGLMDWMGVVMSAVVFLGGGQQDDAHVVRHSQTRPFHQIGDHLPHYRVPRDGSTARGRYRDGVHH